MSQVKPCFFCDGAPNLVTFIFYWLRIYLTAKPIFTAIMQDPHHQTRIFLPKIKYVIYDKATAQYS